MCRQKLNDFYEYYNFVLQNQIKYKSTLEEISREHLPEIHENVPKPDVVFLIKEEIVIESPCGRDLPVEVKVEPSVCVESQKIIVPKKTLKGRNRKGHFGGTGEKKPRGRPTKPKSDEQLKYMAEDALMQKYFQLKCLRCKKGKEFTRYRDFNFHMKRRHYTNAVLECCGIKLLSRINALRHCNDHESPLKCDDCDETFAGRQVLKAHVADVHNKIIPLDDRVFICNECGKTKIEKKNIWHHLKSVHFCQNTHVCEICAVVYKTLPSLQMHINVEHKNFKLPRTQCEHCGRWVQERHLSTHIKNHLVLPEPVTCQDCGRECKSKKLLQKHMRKYHSPWSKKHQCNYCPKSFMELICLKEHIATHTGISLYHCEFCGAQFKSNGNYSAHKRRLHPVEYAKQKQANKIKREQAAVGLGTITDVKS